MFRRRLTAEGTDRIPLGHGRSRDGLEDLLVAAGDPEATAIEDAEQAEVFGVNAPVATLEHPLFPSLYSNQSSPET